MSFTKIKDIGLKPVQVTINKLLPYLKLKSPQARLALKIIEQALQEKKITPHKLLSLAKEVDLFANLNYSKRRRNTAQVVEEFLRTKYLL